MCEERKEKLKQYLWLLGINLFISAFTFGGGYVVVPMIRQYFVLKKGYFSEEELMDMAAVAQSTPGAIAVNLSALAGYRTAGMAGAVISCVAAVLPPLIILGTISAFYHIFISNAVLAAVLKGMEAGVAAVMVADDLPGMNGYGGMVPDKPVIAKDEVLYEGDPVALVAAETKEIAEKAVKLILSGDDTYSDFDARVEFLFLPPYSPDLNPIEGVWRIARREQTYNHFFRKLDDLRYNLTSYFARFTAPNAKLA